MPLFKMSFSSERKYIHKCNRVIDLEAFEEIQFHQQFSHDQLTKTDFYTSDNATIVL